MINTNSTRVEAMHDYVAVEIPQGIALLDRTEAIKLAAKIVKAASDVEAVA